jgi:hypothetical protein
MDIGSNTTSKTIDHMIDLACFSAEQKQWLDVEYYINYACSFALKLNDKRLNDLLALNAKATFICKGNKLI